MRILLDTHALLWWLGDDPQLPESARASIAAGANQVAVSAASAWEISIKRALGKLQVPDDLVAQIRTNGFHPLAMTVEHGMAAGDLPRHHDDPFDRMLIAQARLEGLVIATRDPQFTTYDVELLPLWP